MKIEGLDEALSRVGYDDKGRRRTWNHRVVTRHSEHGSWLEVAEVHYVDGVPGMFGAGQAPLAELEDDEDGAGVSPIADALADLRETLQRMLAALDQPILDERVDFKAGDAW